MGGFLVRASLKTAVGAQEKLDAAFSSGFHSGLGMVV
jgi:hypothetical protein